MKKRVDIGYHDYVYKLFFEPGLDLAPNESLTRNITFQVTDDCCMNCSYCLTGDTQILMSDFTTKPIKDIRVGDKVMAFPEYGDIKNLHSRDYLCETTVLNTFQRKAPTIAMDIDGNRRLNITKEHKILARRNKSDHSYDYREAGRFKVGQSVYCVPSYEDIDCLSPTFDSDYKIGYIVGVFKGDGSIRRYSYPESGRPQYMYKIRLAVKDAEIINRTKEYLSDLGIDYYTNGILVHNCYQGHKGHRIMSKEVARKGVDLLFDMYEKNDSPFINKKTKAIILDFIGGEPLMAVDVIDYICTYFVQKCLELDHPWLYTWRASMTSNGALYFEPAVQNFLKKFRGNVSFSITLDGPKEIHDACRVYHDGRGNFDDAYAAMKHFNSHYYEELGTKVTIAPENLHNLNKIVCCKLHRSRSVAEGRDGHLTLYRSTAQKRLK